LSTKPKLFNRLILIYSATAALFIALFSLIIIVAEDQMEIISLQHWLDAEANVYIQSVKSIHPTHNISTPNMPVLPNQYEFDFYDKVENLPEWLTSYQHPGFYEHHLGPEDKHFLVREHPNGKDLFYIVFKDNADDYLDEYETKLLIFSLIFGTALLAVMIALGFYLVRLIAVPLVKVQQKIAQMAPANPLFDVDADYQEIAIIEQALLDSKVRIAQFFKREQEFSHFAAHEIRTPLMVLKGSGEMLTSIEFNNQLAIKATQRIIQASNDISLLTNTFLLLGKEQIDKHHFEDILLDQLLQQKIEQLQAQLLRRELTLGIEIERDMHIFAPLDMVQVVINNLFKNALNYSLSPITEPSSWINNDAGTTDQITSINLKLTANKLTLSNLYDASDIEPGFGYGLVIIERICEHLNWQLCVDKSTKIFNVSIIFNTTR
jgi:signal transduction histidine kinase